jgi:hypothetical protein
LRNALPAPGLGELEAVFAEAPHAARRNAPAANAEIERIATPPLLLGTQRLDWG